MEIEKGKTIKYIKEKHLVSQSLKDQLKNFNKIKKMLMASLKTEPKTIPQLATEFKMPADELMYYLMSLLKYGFIETGDVDDNDEYFYYKLKSNG